MNVRIAVMVCIFAGGSTRAVFGSFQDEAVPVEPADLARRPDLIGKKVALDDHVVTYLRRTDQDPDELQLRRTKVTFLVPRKLRPETNPRAVLVTGILRRDGSRVVCDVSELKSVASDLDRLETGVKGLGAKDFQTRKDWAIWAERRARDYKTDTLLQRARELEVEAFRIQTAMKRLGADAPKDWLAMAKDARRRKVPEPEPAALAHRAFRAQLAAAQDASALTEIIQEIEAFFPEASNDRNAARTKLSRWEARYALEPAAIYREAPESARKAFDRQLWADASERLINSEKLPDIASALVAADRAAALIPEKPELRARLIEEAVGRARKNLGSLKQSELKELVGVLREKLSRPEEARTVMRVARPPQRSPARH